VDRRIGKANTSLSRVSSVQEKTAADQFVVVHFYYWLVNIKESVCLGRASGQGTRRIGVLIELENGPETKLGEQKLSTRTVKAKRMKMQ